MLLLLALGLAAVAGGLPVSAVAAAGDKVVARDRYPVVTGRALAGLLVYQRDLPRRAAAHTPRYMRVIAGRTLAVRGLPRNAHRGFEGMGRDGAGRVVLPFVRETLRNRRLRNPRWWLYDVAQDTTRPLRGVPGGACTPINVAVWRTRIAYQLESPSCARPRGIYLRDERGTRPVSPLTVSDATAPLILRGSRLLMVAGHGDGDFSLWRLAAGGRVCPAVIEPSVSPPDHDFSVGGAWLTGRDVSWWMERSVFGPEPPAAGNLILGTRLARGCSKPARTGSFAPLQSRPIAVDGAALYHAAGRVLYRRDISAGPSTAPPPNDDFAHAQPITGSLPLRIGARVGYATRAVVDPPILGTGIDGGSRQATRTLWYVYRPTQAGRQFLIVDQWEFLGPELPYGAFTILTRGTDGALNELPKHNRNDRQFAVVNAAPTDTYWIGVGCATRGPCYPSFGITITTEPPYWPPDAPLAARLVRAP